MTVSIIKSLFAIPILALTPVQRWEAARNFNSIETERWFILIIVIAIVISTVLLVVISFNRIRQERKAASWLFVEYANERGLSVRERQVLLDIANKAGLKSNESIFTLATAFDDGASKLEESSQLRTELSRLREKLGFKKQTASLKKLNSRQIPIGKKLYIRQQKGSDSEEIESTVATNNDIELTVELTKPIKIDFGEFWCVRYCFGSSVLEFDTSVVSYDGQFLVLNHSDNVRFINRRRFLRVPVKRPAFIARFPFSGTFSTDGRKSMKSFRMYRSSTSASSGSWGPPKFVPAVVTELAGPGLRIETSMQVKTGERVLVVFSLDEEQDRDSTTAGAGTLKTVEDIAIVRRTKAIPNGMSIAVELIGLSDSDIDELTRLTNEALFRVNAGIEKASASTNENGKEHVGQPVAAQGNGAIEVRS